MRGWLRFCFSTPTHASTTATIVIAVVTTIYAIVSCLQWLALKSANDINGQNIYEIQRPFTSVLGVEGQPQQTGGDLTGVAFNIHAENSGSTPAASLIFQLNFYHPKDPMPNDYGFADLDDVIIYPGVGAPRSAAKTPSKGFTIPQLAEFQRRDRFMYIYGQAVYNDRFKNTPRHYTLFCFQLASIGGPDISNLPHPNAPGTTLSFDWPTCRRHNCTDEECKEQGFIK